jgi:hypothetical protein
MEDGAGTSPPDELVGKQRKEVDSVGEYEGLVDGLLKKGRSSTKFTSREIHIRREVGS